MDHDPDRAQLSRSLRRSTTRLAVAGAALVVLGVVLLATSVPWYPALEVGWGLAFVGVALLIGSAVSHLSERR